MLNSLIIVKKKKIIIIFIIIFMRVLLIFHKCPGIYIENVFKMLIYIDLGFYATPSGLLRLEELVRHFLISRETLSVRMLDENLDPTPLLKEIRDDKVATIIIDANASVSILILKKVCVLI